jgi:hypothetical protein
MARVSTTAPLCTGTPAVPPFGWGFPFGVSVGSENWIREARCENAAISGGWPPHPEATALVLRAGERPLPRIGDRQPGHLDPPPATRQCPPRRPRKPVAHNLSQHLKLKPVLHHHRHGAAGRRARKHSGRAELVGIESAWFHRHCTPVRLSRCGCSCQCGRASAPMMPHRVHTMRGPNDGTVTWSGHGSALRIVRWWHCQHDTLIDDTPLRKMPPPCKGCSNLSPVQHLAVPQKPATAERD